MNALLKKVRLKVDVFYGSVLGLQKHFTFLICTFYCKIYTFFCNIYTLIFKIYTFFYKFYTLTCKICTFSVKFTLNL